jgi:hypothetical protein
MDKVSTIYITLGTAILSSFIAISVVLLNQWFLERRSRKELLRGKLEEFYLLLIKTIELQSQRYSLYLKHHSDGGFEQWNNEKDEIEQLYYKLKMFQSLYFNALSKKYLSCFHHHSSLNEIIYRFSHVKIETPQHDDMCKRFASVHFSLTELRAYVDSNSERLIRKFGKKENELENAVELINEKVKT